MSDNLRALLNFFGGNIEAIRSFVNWHWVMGTYPAETAREVLKELDKYEQSKKNLGDVKDEE